MVIITVTCTCGVCGYTDEISLHKWDYDAWLDGKENARVLLHYLTKEEMQLLVYDRGSSCINDIELGGITLEDAILIADKMTEEELEEFINNITNKRRV